MAKQITTEAVQNFNAAHAREFKEVAEALRLVKKDLESCDFEPGSNDDIELTRINRTINRPAHLTRHLLETQLIDDVAASFNKIGNNEQLNHSEIEQLAGTIKYIDCAKYILSNVARYSGKEITPFEQKTISDAQEALDSINESLLPALKGKKLLSGGRLLHREGTFLAQTVDLAKRTQNNLAAGTARNEPIFTTAHVPGSGSVGVHFGSDRRLGDETTRVAPTPPRRKHKLRHAEDPAQPAAAYFHGSETEPVINDSAIEEFPLNARNKVTPTPDEAAFALGAKPRKPSAAAGDIDDLREEEPAANPQKSSGKSDASASRKRESLIIPGTFADVNKLVSDRKQFEIGEADLEGKHTEAENAARRARFNELNKF